MLTGARLVVCDRSGARAAVNVVAGVTRLAVLDPMTEKYTVMRTDPKERVSEMRDP